MIRSDFEDPFSSRYNKRKLRDMLFFKRFLKEKYGNLTTDDFSKEVELYQKVIDMSDTGKGYDEKNDISSTYTREFRQIRKSTSWNLEEKFLTYLRQVVIFGHSLKADEDFFHYIFERSTNIKSIVLFTYQGEPLAQIREKEKLLKKFFGENPGIATCNFKMIPYRLNN